MQETVDFVVRNSQPEDRSFILASWLRAYRHNSQFAKRLRNQEFFSYHHAIINRILDRESSNTKIACSSEDANLIYGFFTYEKALGMDIAHFLYVKKSFRGFGIAKELFDNSDFNIDQTTFSHWTYPMDTIKEKYPNLVYCPYLL